VQLTPTFKIKTQPTSEPVSPSDLQSHLNADQIDDGGKVQRVLTAAREKFEMDSGVSLMPTVWQCFLDCFPGCDEGGLKLFRGPVTAIGSVAYVDSSGDTTTLDTDDYQTDIKRTPARIAPAYGLAWPVIQSSTLNAVTIEFTAGFTSVANVPAKAKQAILMLAGSWLDDPAMQGQVPEAIYGAYWSMVNAVHWEVFDE